MGILNTLMATGTSERRAQQRSPISQITCDLGPLLDIAVTGMRVDVDSGVTLRRGQKHVLTLRVQDSEFPVAAQVVWCDDPGSSRRSYTVGFRFLLSEDEVLGLTRLLQQLRVRRSRTGRRV